MTTLLRPPAPVHSNPPEVGPYVRELGYRLGYNTTALLEADNRKSQAKFLCVSCGHRANADVNAALNIRARAVSSNAALELANPLG